MYENSLKVGIQRNWLAVMLVGIVASCLAICASAQTTDHHAFGALTIGFERVTTDYTALYHPVHKIPLWVAYKVESDVDAQPDIPRISPFITDDFDPPLPDYARLKHKHYTNSGFDRGHMFPHAAAEQGGEDVVEESYRMTNMCPQTGDLNQSLWKFLEEQVRIWAADKNDVWVITGPILPKYDELGPLGRTLPNSSDHFNAKRQNYFYSEKDPDTYIVITQAFFKIVVSDDGPDPDIIAFIMPQMVERVGSLGLAQDEFRKFIVTVDEIEERTGIDFLPDLGDNALGADKPDGDEQRSIWGLP